MLQPKRSHSKSILFYLTTYLVSLCSIAVPLAGYISFLESKKSIKETVFQHLNNIANVKKGEVQSWLEEQSIYLLNLLESANVKNDIIEILAEKNDFLLNSKKIESIKQKFIEYHLNKPSIEEILIVDRRGKVIVSSNYYKITKYQPLSEYTELVKNTKNNLKINIYRSLDTGKPRITLAIPIKKIEEKILGYIAINLNLDILHNKIITRNALGATGESYLVADMSTTFSNRYEFISQESFNLEKISPNIDSLAIRRALNGINGQDLYKNYRDIDVIGIYHSLNNKNLALIVEISQQEAFEPARKLSISIVLITLSSSLILGFGMFIIGWKMIQPIMDLTKAASLVRKGVQNRKFATLPKVEIPSVNEISFLAQAFNQMTEELKIAYEQLEDYNYTLELKIQNRTLEISEKNRCLENALLELQITQSQLIQSEKMVSLGRLVAGVAHEINNPISFVKGNINYLIEYSIFLLSLLDKYQKKIPQYNYLIIPKAEQKELEFIRQDLPKILTSIKTGTERIGEIVLSLRNFSRLDEFPRKQANINEGIKNTLLILNSRFQLKKIPYQIQLIQEYEQLPCVECYPGELNQAFMNLISNSIDAIEDKLVTYDTNNYIPQIKISTRLINNFICIYIIDNGIGIGKDIQKNIFDPFFTTKPVGKGTGLGLSITYSIIVERHRGEIHFISRLGEGTEFMIKLPIELQQ